MQLRNIGTIFRKELKDTLRDRRTMIFMLLVPVISMPLLMLGISKIAMSQARKIEDMASRIVVQNFGQLPQELQDSLKSSKAFAMIEESAYGATAMDSLKSGSFDLLLVVPPNFAAALEMESKTDLEIYYDKAEDRSSSANSKLRELLDDYKERLVEGRIVKRGISEEVLTPFEEVRNNVSSAQKLAGMTLGRMLPYFFILMCFLGAMYPALDLCVGEKERGTLETLLVAPATRGEFVLGKYFVILLTGMTAGLLCTLSMTYSLNYMMKDMMPMQATTVMPSLQFDAKTLVLLLMIVVPLAGIFAAILLSVSIFAKSAKEAQGYMGFLNMFLIIPAFVSFLPGFELDMSTAMIPVVSTSLIIRDAIAGEINWPLVILGFVASFALAALALWFAKKWFEREEVLFRV